VLVVCFVGLIAIILWTCDTYRAVVEPSEHKVVASLHGLGIGFGSAVGFEVVAAVFKGDSASAFELFVVPLGDFGVGKKGVVSAGKASFHTLGDVVVERQVCAERVRGVLPVAVLRLVDRLKESQPWEFSSWGWIIIGITTYKPLINQMVIPLDNKSSIIEKVINNLTIAPSTVLIEKSKRRIPVEEHRSNLEALLHQLSNNTIIVFHALLVDRTFTKRKDARPRDRKAESRHAQTLQAGEILFVEVVVGSGDVGGGVVGDLVDDTVAEEVPDRRAFAFGVDGALLWVVSNAWLFPILSRTAYFDLEG
jgi:hypothetical protein